MVLNNLFPVFFLIVLGSLLKRREFTNETFLKTSDRLVYYIFFPALLFWKIGGASSDLTGVSDLYKAVICSVLAVYGLSSLFVKLSKVSDYQVGSFSQSCYRFNTYIGVAVILNAFGEEGIKQFGILIGLIIPIINVLAVGTLTWFSGKPYSFPQRVAQLAKALISNPLILACIGGIFYAKMIREFPVFVDNALKLAAFVTLPLALLSIGGSLTLKSMRNHFRLAMIASVFKLLVLPLIGYGFFKVFDVSGMSFKLGMIYLALPTSTASYVLSSQLNSDTELASASIALSTILSFFSLSIALLI